MPPNAYVDRVRSTGYSPGEVARLHEIGLSDNAISRLRAQQTIYDPGDATPGSIDATFDGLATEMRDTASEAEDFAADAWTFAGRPEQRARRRLRVEPPTPGSGR